MERLRDGGASDAAMSDTPAAFFFALTDAGDVRAKLNFGFRGLASSAGLGGFVCARDGSPRRAALPIDALRVTPKRLAITECVNPSA